MIFSYSPIFSTFLSLFFLHPFSLSVVLLLLLLHKELLLLLLLAELIEEAFPLGDFMRLLIVSLIIHSERTPVRVSTVMPSRSYSLFSLKCPRRSYFGALFLYVPPTSVNRSFLIPEFPNSWEKCTSMMDKTPTRPRSHLLNMRKVSFLSFSKNIHKQYYLPYIS